MYVTVLLNAGTYNDAIEDPADKCKPCPEGKTTEAQVITSYTEDVLLTAARLVDNTEDCHWNLPGYGKDGKKCPVGEVPKLDKLQIVSLV
jgi:hypothetical protein